MNRMVGIMNLFKLSPEEKGIYQNEIARENARRALILSFIALPVSLFHIVLFVLKSKTVVGIELTWAIAVIVSHSLIVLVSLVGGVLLFRYYFKKKKNVRVFQVVSHAILFFLLLTGSMIAAVDQYVTPAITPFFLSSMVAGLIFLIRPLYSAIYFAVSYIIFCVAISYTQFNPEILISNQVNGVFIAAIGLSLSFILWRSNLTRIKQRKQIIKQNQALIESNAEKDKFFTIIAHDLRSPFNSIVGFSDLLAQQVRDKNYEDVDQYAEIIQQSSKSAMDLLTNLMEWSKAHTGRLEFKPEFFELSTLVQESEQLFNASMVHKNIRFEKRILSDSQVYADKNMIRTVLRNLLSNAIKFSNVDSLVAVTIERDGCNLTFSVSDNGVGIPHNSMTKLFRLDENISTKGTQDEKGTGLGLILCKELVEKHAGKIWCESTFGKGSTFYVTLACCKDGEQTER